MGHERIGILPKTTVWRKVVNNISEFSFENNNVPDITFQTLKNVRTRFELIHKDSGIQSAFQFFVLLSKAAKQNDPYIFLKNNGINLPQNFSPLQLSKSLSDWITNNRDSFEYATFAAKSGIDTISDWHKMHQTGQINLFDFGSNPFDVWNKASNGAGFSDLARLYFSNFTTRYLKYFLEREASANLNSITLRNNFNSQIEKHVTEIAKHAFETTKITQSFAAGWYNKNAIEDIPTKRKIAGFLYLAFGKLRDELLREESR